MNFGSLIQIVRTNRDRNCRPLICSGLPRSVRMFLLCLCSIIPFSLQSQTLLEADGPGNTYELINSVLAPGYDVVENPECIHPEFGRHIAEVWDAHLGKYVFEFYSHVTPDNDRCINFDRQRVEIKTYASSPEHLIGRDGETITYRWRFRLPAGFQPSTSFTHLHQIKAVGGDDADPIFTITARKGSPNRIELIHNNTTKVTTTDLSLFESTWVQCREVVTVGAHGSYSMNITNVSTGAVILSFSSSDIMTIRPDNTFIRPKWGIYRSLDHPSDLRDEAVRFAGFSIQEGPATGRRSENAVPGTIELEQNFPNPFNPSTIIRYRLAGTSKVELSVVDYLGRVADKLVDETQPSGIHRVEWNGDRFPSGVYLCRLQIGLFAETTKMVLIK